jgi:hypothetical protein
MVDSSSVSGVGHARAVLRARRRHPESTGAEAFTAIFSYGAMPYDLAEANLRLFAAEVMPALKRRVPVEDQLIARAGVGVSANASAFRLPI